MEARCVAPTLLLSLCVSEQVTGEANESQVCEALRRYQDRECFVHEALVHLYNLVIDISEPRPDMLKVPCGWEGELTGGE